MSRKADNTFRVLQKLYGDLLRIRWINDGYLLRPKADGIDRATCAAAYTCFAAQLIDLGCIVEPALAAKYVIRLANLDIAELAKAMKAADQTLLRKWATDEELTLSDLKHHFESLGTWVFRPYVSMLLRIVRGNNDLQPFIALHQVWTFMSRLSLRCVDGDKFILEFVARNENVPSVDLQLAERLQPIIAKLLHGIVFEPWGRHGSGTTCDAGRVSPIEKTLFIHPDVVHKHAFCQEGWEINDFTPFPGLVPCELNRIVKVMTVPKNATTRRIIAAETVTQQWFQQLVRKALYRHIKRNIRSIPLIDQGVNRQRAMEGSISGSLATIDLTAASDSVSWILVKTAFAKSGIMHWLYAARSRTIQYVISETVSAFDSKSQRIVEKKVASEYRKPLNMFATMGSAICFPIECLVFDAICRLATEDAGYKHYDCTVYGDDIVCPTDIAPLIMKYLVRLGFQPSLTKSFYNDQPVCYRESCGGEYVGGVDVSTVKIPRKFTDFDPICCPTSYTTWVDLINRCYERGYKYTRIWLLNSMLSRPTVKVPIPWADGSGITYRYSPEINPAFGSQSNRVHTSQHRVILDKSRARWNTDLQVLELWVTRTQVNASKSKYLGWWFPEMLETHGPNYDIKMRLSDWLRIEQRLRSKADFEYLDANCYIREIVHHLSYFLWCAYSSDMAREDVEDHQRFLADNNAIKVDAGYELVLTNDWQNSAF